MKSSPESYDIDPVRYIETNGNISRPARVATHRARSRRRFACVANERRGWPCINPNLSTAGDDNLECRVRRRPFMLDHTSAFVPGGSCCPRPFGPWPALRASDYSLDAKEQDRKEGRKEGRKKTKFTRGAWRKGRAKRRSKKEPHCPGGSARIVGRRMRAARVQTRNRLFHSLAGSLYPLPPSIEQLLHPVDHILPS